jgi:hypothetical protein
MKRPSAWLFRSKKDDRRLALFWSCETAGQSQQTRAAIAAFESTHNLVVDGTISRRLLARMGLA